MFGLKFVGRGVELHNYNIGTGKKNYIFEYQNNKIDFIDYSTFSDKFYWFIFHETITTGMSYILKISQTRRYVYRSTSKSTFSSLVFPDKNPLLVGFTYLNEPFLVHLSNSEFESIWSTQISDVKSNMMIMKNRYDGDTSCIWALSDISDEKIQISGIDANTSSISWTKTYEQKLASPYITYASVFEEYILVGKDNTRARHCFMRFKGSGEMTYLF